MFLLWLCVYFLRNGSGNRLRQITGWVLLVWVIQSVKDMVPAPCFRTHRHDSRPHLRLPAV